MTPYGRQEEHHARELLRAADLRLEN